MSQYDLFGDAAQVGGLRCLDAAVGGRAALAAVVHLSVLHRGAGRRRRRHLSVGKADEPHAFAPV